MIYLKQQLKVKSNIMLYLLKKNCFSFYNIIYHWYAVITADIALIYIRNFVVCMVFFQSAKCYIYATIRYYLTLMFAKFANNNSLGIISIKVHSIGCWIEICFIDRLTCFQIQASDKLLWLHSNQNHRNTLFPNFRCNVLQDVLSPCCLWYSLGVL